MDATIGQALGRALAEAGVSQYWLARRARESAVTVCRIVNENRHPTEAQLLRLCCGLLCAGTVYAAYLDVVYAGPDAGRVIARLAAAQGLRAIDVARRSHVGRMTVECFLRGDAALSPAKIMRIFASVAFDEARLVVVNHLLELAGYYVIGESDDDRRSA